MNRGSNEQVTLLEPETVASMRPRFMNRGSGRYESAIRADIAASMRPRFMNRGSRQWALVEVINQVKLQ